MTIAVIWQEDGSQWCAADTRLVAGIDDQSTTEIAAKIFVIPVMAGALDSELKPRQPHYWIQYGFVYAGAALLGSGAPMFASALAVYRGSERNITKRIPRRVIDKMVAERQDRTVGGATSIGVAHQHGFELYYALEPVVSGQPMVRRIFNGLDLDTEVGQVGQYVVAVTGIA